MTGKPMFLCPKWTVVASVIAAALLAPLPLRADSRDRGRDHDAARYAVQRGEIRPLTDILAIVRNKLPGEIAGVKIERENGHWVYEFRAVDVKGRLFEVYVDAKTGEIERVKEK